MLITSVIFALVQSLSEFLPISSSGHLLLLHSLFKSNLGDDLVFDTILHGGTLVALVLYFFKDYWKIFKEWSKSIFSQTKTPESNLGWYIILATIPAGLAGLKGADYIELIFRKPIWTAVMLVVFGLILIWAEKKSSEQKIISDLSWWQVLVIGCSQALALIPGVSRSGITMTTGLFFNQTRVEAAKFSFLLSGPIIAGAFLSQAIKVNWSSLSQLIIWEYLMGFVVSGLAGYLVVGWFLDIIKKVPLRYFAYYRFILAAVVIIILALN